MPNTRGEILDVRLERETPWGGAIGCSLILGTFLILFGSFPIYMTITRGKPDERMAMYLFGGVFIAVGLLVLYSGIHQALATKTKEMIVEAETTTLQRGSKVRFYFRQDGPVSIESIHANLVGEEKWSVRRSRYNSTTRQSETYNDHQTKHLGTFRFLEQGEAEVSGDTPLEVQVTFEIPRDIPATHGPEGDEQRSVSWKIEVWGVVRRRADFMHPYLVTVV